MKDWQARSPPSTDRPVAPHARPRSVVASALLTDYVLTVAVSVSSGTDNIISAFPELVFAIMLAAMLGPGVLTVILALATVWWPGIARLALPKLISPPMLLHDVSQATCRHVAQEKPRNFLTPCGLRGGIPRGGSRLFEKFIGPGVV